MAASWSSKRVSWGRAALRVHRFLAISGGIALALWGGSGLLHVVMTNFGPQPTRMRPPVQPIDLASARPLDETLARARIPQAAAIRIVAGDGESLLQVTEDQDRPRRYFELDSGREKPDHDRAHAEFLARYYLGLDSDAAGSATPTRVRSIERVTEFSDAYPWVNRLLPVYRVEFDRPDRLTAYVYTETNALASVTDARKAQIQTAFSAFHTWSWFPRQAEWVRVIVIGYLVGSLLCLSLTGSVLLRTLRARSRRTRAQRLHRWAAFAGALPMLLFTVSALFHLIWFAGEAPGRILRLAPPLSLEGVAFPLHEQWEQISGELHVSSVSIIEDQGGRVLYRLGLAMPRGSDPTAKAAIRNARFDGVPTTGPALYFDSQTGAPIDRGDREIAVGIGARWLGDAKARPEHMELVTRFGPTYDFRNKRLPVWRLDYEEPLRASVFVDTTTSCVVDVLADSDRPERFVFAFLHKWNFLFPLGRGVQSAVVATVVALSILVLGGSGFALAWSRQRARR
ncbi:MAG: PepSY domain-containing protein [Proteobacteria bacterium]|nr:PepSY domain-containing protein [Pseudomonadota bacterium]